MNCPWLVIKAVPLHGQFLIFKGYFSVSYDHWLPHLEFKNQYGGEKFSKKIRVDF